VVSEDRREKVTATGDTASGVGRRASGTTDTSAFWFGFEVSWAKIVVGRVVVFGMLAVDALLQIRHAPRYGVDGFNVAQLPGVGWLAPARTGYAVGQLACAYLFALVACGAVTRVALPIATALYAWLYFSSQLDAYQHHYLVAVVLVIACFVPWQRPPGAALATPVRAWALRLVLVELAIMYLWAAFSKLDGAWLDGTIMELMRGAPRAVIDATVGTHVAAWIVPIVELALAATIWIPRAWPVAAPLGIAFHVAIALSGLEIGLFAWLMIAMYVFVVPEVVWTKIARTITKIRPRASGLGPRGVRARWIVAVGASVIGVVIAWWCRIPDAWWVAIVVAIVPIVAVARRGVAAAHVVAIVLWVVVDRVSPVASDYYRYWDGALRQLGRPYEAERVDRAWVAAFPDDGAPHYRLGQTLLAIDDPSGLDELHVAQRLEPGRARAYVAEARWLASRGRVREAIERAREAVFSEPNDPAARALLRELRRGGAVTAPLDDDRE
jgi:hypothetical protein